MLPCSLWCPQPCGVYAPIPEALGQAQYTIPAVTNLRALLEVLRLYTFQVLKKQTENGGELFIRNNPQPTKYPTYKRALAK